MDRKSYVDIENLRTEDINIAGIIRRRNDCGFFKGDTISITEKIDGSNASIRYDVNTGKLECYSRKQTLNFEQPLRGFWNWVQTLDPSKFADHPNWVIFGEWLCKNKIKYDAEKVDKWYVYSIYDVENEKWMNQDIVKEYCKTHDLTYIHEFYYGPFISWEHCKQFSNSPQYGERQEGIVVRNITRMDDPTVRFPHILKIVNDDFAESKKMREVDPEKERAKAVSYGLMETIVTPNRIEKELLKMRNEGIIPDEIQPTDMATIAKNLPKRIYQDCMKEEPEVMEACGEYAGKACSSLAMKIARDLIFG